MLGKVVREYSWATDARTSEFILRDFDTWAAQNSAECIDCVEGCLLDNLVMACKRGVCFLFEIPANEWCSKWRCYFIPYKEQESNSDYSRLWDRFEGLRELSMAE